MVQFFIFLRKQNAKIESELLFKLLKIIKGTTEVSELLQGK